MKTWKIMIFICLILPVELFAQLDYTQNQFQVRIESNIKYGVATNYAGLPDTLVMDLYKPVGDTNCHRPVLVIIHGGSWIAGNKNSGDVVSVANQMAAKGYVVASIKYRLGTHKAASWTQWLLCSTSLVTPCIYICDSSEVYRAIFRGMQDAKGAIRFLKNRTVTDSTDAENVFVAGTSAGAFIAMATAFIDLPDEKPADCYSIKDAPVPASGLSGCNPKGTSYLRPDLGSIEGELNTGGANAKVKGVGCFFGGMPTLQWMKGTDTPAVYLFHQYADVIVSAGYYPLLARITYECLNGLCQPVYFYPWMYGGKSIADSLKEMDSSSLSYTADIINNWNGSGNCLQNPPGHAIDNVVLRSQNMADLFAKVIAESGNNPGISCITTGVTADESLLSVSVYPNPVTESFMNIVIKGTSNEQVHLVVHDLLGRTIYDGISIIRKDVVQIHLPDISKGIYFLSCLSSRYKTTTKFIISR